MVIALILYFGFVLFMSWKREHENYKTYYFDDNDKTYSLTIHLKNGQLQNGARYDVFERFDLGSAGTEFDGTYFVKNDTLYLTSFKKKNMRLFKNTLMDYPQTGMITMLRSDRAR